MRERAALLGLDQQDANNLNDEEAAGRLLRMPLLLNFFCKVNAAYILSGEAGVGLPPLFGMVKFFGGHRVAQFDLFDVCWGAFGVLQTKTLFRQHSMVTMPSLLGMAGFVGIHVHVPFMLNIYNGYSAITFAAGLGPQHQLQPGHHGSLRVLPWRQPRRYTGRRRGQRDRSDRLIDRSIRRAIRVNEWTGIQLK